MTKDEKNLKHFSSEECIDCSNTEEKYQLTGNIKIIVEFLSSLSEIALGKQKRYKR